MKCREVKDCKVCDGYPCSHADVKYCFRYLNNETLRERFSDIKKVTKIDGNFITFTTDDNEEFRVEFSGGVIVSRQVKKIVWEEL